MMETLSRRRMIQSLCGGLGSVGLSALLGEKSVSAAIAGHYSGPNLSAKARQVIFLFMAGGPSQIDMFDPKPSLLKYQGQRPDSVNLRTERQTGGLLPSPFEFKKRGRSGIDVSELLPQVRTPTLVLHCRNDAVQPFEEGRKIAAGIAGARFVALEGRNHLILESDPAWSRFLDEIGNFLRP